MKYIFNVFTGKLDTINDPLDLSGYITYTGATSDVNLNNKSLVNVNKIGIGITTPNSNLQVGSVSFGFVTKSANYTLTATDRTVECITNASTQTLPTAVGCSGREYRIINATNLNITVATTSSQTIGNKVTGNLTTITLAPEEWLDVISNNANWRII